jgi:hypothetical protein
MVVGSGVADLGVVDLGKAKTWGLDPSESKRIRAKLANGSLDVHDA